MKVISFPLALQAAMLATVFAASSRAEEAGTAAVAKEDVQAKLEYCKTCHGLNGQGFRGTFPMPRLAGQQAVYIETQLKSFVEGRRTNPFMSKVAHALSPAMLAALTMNFGELNPKPLGGAPKDLLAAGKKVYEEGLPDAHVPACASCHGAEAKGDGKVPRLAGQLNDYVVRKLANWSVERLQDPASGTPSGVVDPAAHALTESQAAAVAAYLSYLE
jgi:cytochrome c553